MSVFKGSGVAIITPFDENGVNFEVFGQLIDFQIESGTDAIIVCGTTGEPATMTESEKQSTIRFAVERVAGRVPVIAGSGGNNTAKAIADSKKAQELGADALLIVTPYYNKCTQGGLYAHFAAIDAAVDLPIIVYNVPGRNIQPATMKKLATLPHVVGLKEASGNIEQITEIARLCPGLDLYSGNDDHVVPLLSLGGIGVISVTANVCPREVHDMVMDYHEGREEQARRTQLRYLDLINALFMDFLDGDLARSRALQFKLNPLSKNLFTEVNPIPVKAAVGLLGYDVGTPRLPLTPMSEAPLAALKAEMAALGLIKE